MERDSDYNSFLDTDAAEDETVNSEIEIACYQRALTLAKEQKEEEQIGNANIELGDVYVIKNRFHPAIECYTKALETAKYRNDKERETRAYLRLGNAYRLDDQIEKAIHHYTKALEISKKARHKHLHDFATDALEEFSRITDSPFQEAPFQETFQETELVTDQDIKNRHEESIQIGSSAGYDVRCQIKSHGEAFEIVETDDNGSKARKYQTLGNICTKNSEYKKAIENYEKAREVFPELETDKTEITAYQWLAYNLLKQGDQYEKSIGYYKEALKLAVQLRDDDTKFNLYLELGFAFNCAGDFESSKEYYKEAVAHAEQMGDKSLQMKAHTNLGNAYHKSGEFQAAVTSYSKVEKISQDLGEREEKPSADDEDNSESKHAFGLTNLYLCYNLGLCYSQLGRFAESLSRFIKALEIVSGHSDISLQGVIEEWCGYCCTFINDKQEEAIEYYTKSKHIARQIGEKYQEYRSNQAIGNIYSNNGNYKQAKEYYQEGLMLAVELDDRLREGQACLNLACVCCNDREYNTAIEWYKKALAAFETEVNGNVLKAKAFTGLGIAYFNLGNTEKATESIGKARRFAVKQINKDSPFQETSFQEAFQETELITDKWVNLVIEEACNPCKTKRLQSNDLARLEKFIEEFSASYVYTHRATAKEPLSEKVRKSMITNVKSSAYKSLLSQCIDEDGQIDGKFVNYDQQIFNLARDDASKNASTKRPAMLLHKLGPYVKSIGRISCGRKTATCWLVTDTLVVTNHHVFMMFQKERDELQNPNIPVEVWFDYFHQQQPEHICKVEVDNKRDPQLESSYLDYKFLRLKNSEALAHRIGLGPIVRNRSLHEGLVIIIGHPAGEEMLEETCVVVRRKSWREILKQRKEESAKRHDTIPQNPDPQYSAGVHIVHDCLLQLENKEEGCLQYDTTLFSGVSGSPVFDLNGNIVAMHTHGYILDMEEGKTSLMEFGVTFKAICEDLRRRNVLKQYFPDYNLGEGEVRMEQD